MLCWSTRRTSILAVKVRFALIAHPPNLLAVQTLLKSRSLAGLWIGFACGQVHLMDALTRVKNSVSSYPLDGLASAGAAATLEDEA